VHFGCGITAGIFVEKEAYLEKGGKAATKHNSKEKEGRGGLSGGVLTCGTEIRNPKAFLSKGLAPSFLGKSKKNRACRVLGHVTEVLRAGVFRGMKGDPGGTWKKGRSSRGGRKRFKTFRNGFVSI